MPLDRVLERANRQEEETLLIRLQLLRHKQNCDHANSWRRRQTEGLSQGTAFVLQDAPVKPVGMEVFRGIDKGNRTFNHPL